jgi:23S rRNA pseudouridine1911/1915/1917 synthase
MTTQARPAAGIHYLRVGPEDAELRLDRWLAAKLPDQSRNAIQRWIRDGEVTVNGLPARPSQRLVAGNEVAVVVPEKVAPRHLVAEPIPLTILYEDNDLLVVDKPSGLVVHPAPGNESGTLVNALLHYIPDLPGVDGEPGRVRRPGIVHRLDKDTSGVMVVAKHDQALRFLQAQFKAREIHKEYLALVEGKLAPSKGRIQALIGRHPVDRKRQAVIAPGAVPAAPRTARPAVTDYQVEALYRAPVRQGIGSYSLVRACPITGRTHQIRVHLAWRGHPIVGDPIYGLRRVTGRAGIGARLQAPRLFLHAECLEFCLPSSGQRRLFVAPLPPDLQAVLDALQNASQ